jgi:hypothetical protein
VIDPSASAFPLWRFLGIISRTDTSVSWRIQLRAVASAAAGTLDIDTLVIVDVQNPNTCILGLDPADQSAVNTLNITHQWLNKPNPTVDGTDIAIAPITYRGDPAIFTNGANLYALHLGTGGNSPNRWRYEISASTVTQHNLTATRHVAYLTPQ